MFWRSISDVGISDMHDKMITMNILDNITRSPFGHPMLLQGQSWCKYLKCFPGPLPVNLMTPVEQAKLAVEIP